MNMLPLLVLVPLVGGLLAWLGEFRDAGGRVTRAVSVGTLCVLALVLADVSLGLGSGGGSGGAAGGWFAHFSRPWIPALGIRFQADLDGLGLVLLWLTVALSFVCVLSATRDVTNRPGLFHLLLLTTIAGVNGVFMATDLFLFLFFWELMLVPMYVLIVLWGHEAREAAAIKFFLYTQAGGLLMMVSILALVILHDRQTGVLTFDYFALANTVMSPRVGLLVGVGFFLAFAVKLPVVPLHVWLPDTHTQAPTAGSVLLAGVLLKTGGYGLIRFVVLFFPHVAHQIQPFALALGAFGILYGAWLSLVQTDLKRLIAYSSVSHLGFVLLGVFSGTAIGMQGAVMQMVAHGLSTGALFVIAGSLQDRLHTRELGRMGGLWAVLPHLSATALFFSMASLGLPGAANFVGEFLVLLGVWHVSPVVAVLGTLGLVLSAAYSLTMVGRAFMGTRAADAPPLVDFGGRQMAVLGAAMVAVVVLGMYPRPVLDLSHPAGPGVVRVER